MAISDTIIVFLISLVISTGIIYVVTKLFGEREGFGTAISAALIGTVIYAIAYYFLGTGILATVIGGVAWLLALGGLYNMGWLKSFVVAVVIWVLATIVSLIMPTVTGPL